MKGKHIIALLISLVFVILFLVLTRGELSLEARYGIILGMMGTWLFLEIIQLIKK